MASEYASSPVAHTRDPRPELVVGRQPVDQLGDDLDLEAL